MWRSRKSSRLVSSLAILGALSATSSGSARESALSPERSRARPPVEERWIPGLALSAGALVHDRDGTVSSTELDTDSGESRVPIAFLGVGAEVSSPALFDGFGAPRLFLHSDISWSFDTDEGLVNRDEPGQPRVPPINNFPVLGVPGQGQALRVESTPLIASAALGLSFTLDGFSRDVRIKPMLSWNWQRDKLTTLFGLAESEGPNADFCSPCRTVSIDASTKEDFHSLGPGIEVEFDAARSGDLMWTLFVSAHSLRLLTDDSVRVRESGAWQTNDQPSLDREPSEVSAFYERDPWSYRFAVGLRLLWLPED
jgi:hypothetical protein